MRYRLKEFQFVKHGWRASNVSLTTKFIISTLLNSIPDFLFLSSSPPFPISSMASQTQDKEKSLTHLRTLVPPNEVFDESHPSYHASSAPWSTHEDLHPTLVLQPSTLETLTRLVPALYASNLDFAVRNTGTGSVSARDVILSTQGLKDFHFNPADETVTLGSGFSWGEVDALMEEHAPGYAVVGARCGWVGVTGSALVGGLSWLSHEFGMISDPGNLLDMQIVLRDGRAVWAGEADEELMWALRGGGGNFGGKAISFPRCSGMLDGYD